jgi:hypothetical protein
MMVKSIIKLFNYPPVDDEERLINLLESRATTKAPMIMTKTLSERFL